jgi:hypothetical protein
VAHELAITTAYEKSFAVFRRVSKVRMTQEVLARFVPAARISMNDDQFRQQFSETARRETRGQFASPNFFRGFPLSFP